MCFQWTFVKLLQYVRHGNSPCWQLHCSHHEPTNPRKGLPSSCHHHRKATIFVAYATRSGSLCEVEEWVFAVDYDQSLCHLFCLPLKTQQGSSTYTKLDTRCSNLKDKEDVSSIKSCSPEHTGPFGNPNLNVGARWIWTRMKLSLGNRPLCLLREVTQAEKNSKNKSNQQAAHSGYRYSIPRPSTRTQYRIKLSKKVR